MNLFMMNKPPGDSWSGLAEPESPFATGRALSKLEAPGHRSPSLSRAYSLRQPY